MATVPSKVKTGISNPRLAFTYTKRQMKLARALATFSEYKLAALFFLDRLSESERLRNYLQTTEDARYVERDVLDFRMRLDLLDEGISRDLLIYGVREPLATSRYRQELARLEDERGGLTVVDIGANIGYFAFQSLAQNRSNGEVIAIEPLPGNFSLLQENVRLNGFEDSIECYQCAVGATSKSATMEVSTHSNLGAVTDTAIRGPYVDEIVVQMKSLDELLRVNGVPFESVDVLRMDLQGYEYQVFEGMPELLREGDVGLIFLEIHPWCLKQRDEYEEFLETLRTNGFELVFAADGRTAILREDKQTYSERELDVESLEELRDIDFTVEAILRSTSDR